MKCSKISNFTAEQLLRNSVFNIDNTQDITLFNQKLV